MPTGYAACVEDGTVTEFPDFAMRCARAFGALIEMRGDPLDAPIPEKVKSDSYYAGRLADERRRLSQLQAMSAADISAAYEDDFLKDTQMRKQWGRERAEQDARYDAMLAKVNAWTPPTTEHVELKKFMAEQIRISRSDWEITMPVREDPALWHEEKIAACSRSIEDCKEEVRKEVERSSERNEWVRRLRESLIAS